MRSPLGLVMTFGLGRTPAQAGMLQVLAEMGIEADSVTGTSLGAINAAAHAGGCSPADLEQFWVWMHDEVLDSPLRAIARGVATKQAQKQAAGVRARIAQFLPETFEELDMPLRLVATNLETGTAEVFDSGDLVTAVMASCALPGVLPPVAVGSGHYIDGGLVAGMPLLEAGDECRSVIVLDTGDSSSTVEVASGYRWWEVGALAYAHQIRGQAVHALHLAARRTPVVVVSSVQGRMLDFSDPVGMIEAGRQAAREQLSGLPRRMRRGIYNLPPGLDEFDILRAATVEP